MWLLISDGLVLFIHLSNEYSDIDAKPSSCRKFLSFLDVLFKGISWTWCISTMSSYSDQSLSYNAWADPCFYSKSGLRPANCTTKLAAEYID
jgi:hypothetical protein